MNAFLQVCIFISALSLGTSAAKADESRARECEIDLTKLKGLHFSATTVEQHVATVLGNVGTGRLEISPNGKWIASSTGNDVLSVIDATTMSVKAIQPETSASATPTVLKWLPQSDWLASVMFFDDHLNLFNPVTGAFKKFELHPAEVKAKRDRIDLTGGSYTELDTSPDGRYATVLMNDRRPLTFSVIDTRTGQIVLHLTGESRARFQGGVHSFRFNPAVSNQILISLENGKLILAELGADLKSTKISPVRQSDARVGPIQKMKNALGLGYKPSSSTDLLSSSQDGRFQVAVRIFESDYEVKIFDLEKKKEVDSRFFNLKRLTESVTFKPGDTLYRPERIKADLFGSHWASGQSLVLSYSLGAERSSPTVHWDPLHGFTESEGIQFQFQQRVGTIAEGEIKTVYSSTDHKVILGAKGGVLYAKWQLSNGEIAWGSVNYSGAPWPEFAEFQILAVSEETNELILEVITPVMKRRYLKLKPNRERTPEMDILGP